MILNWLRYARNINDLTYKRLISDDILSVSHVLNIQMNDRIFKLMNENSLDKLLVEDNNKNILGIIDEDNLFKNGDTVNIIESKPISKLKKWKVLVNSGDQQ